METISADWRREKLDQQHLCLSQYQFVVCIFLSSTRGTCESYSAHKYNERLFQYVECVAYFSAELVSGPHGVPVVQAW